MSYVPPHLRPGANPLPPTSSTAEFHATATWSPAQNELKQWLILGGYKKSKGGLFNAKRKGVKTPYYTVYFADALEMPGSVSGKKYGVGLNIHVNKTAGSAWISDIKGCEVNLEGEPNVPAKDIVNEWWSDVMGAETTKL